MMFLLLDTVPNTLLATEDWYPPGIDTDQARSMEEIFGKYRYVYDRYTIGRICIFTPVAQHASFAKTFYHILVYEAVACRRP